MPNADNRRRREVVNVKPDVCTPEQPLHRTSFGYLRRLPAREIPEELSQNTSIQIGDEFENPIPDGNPKKGQDKGQWVSKYELPGIPTKKLIQMQEKKEGRGHVWMAQSVYEKNKKTLMVTYVGWNASTIYEEPLTPEFIEQNKEVYEAIQHRDNFLKAISKDQSLLPVARQVATCYMWNFQDNVDHVFWTYEDLTYFHSRIQKNFGLPEVFYVCLRLDEVEPPKFQYTTFNIVCAHTFELHLRHSQHTQPFQDPEARRRSQQPKRRRPNRGNAACEKWDSCVCNKRYTQKLSHPDRINLEPNREGLLNFTELLPRHGSILIECSDACGCSAQCPRRRLQKGQTKRLVVFYENRFKGFGLRAAEMFETGEFICEMVGVVRAREPNEEKYDKNRHGLEVMDENLVMDTNGIGNLARFIQFVDVDPSAILIETNSRIRETDPLIPRISVYALKPIAIGDRVTVLNKRTWTPQPLVRDIEEAVANLEELPEVLEEEMEEGGPEAEVEDQIDLGDPEFPEGARVDMEDRDRRVEDEIQPFFQQRENMMQMPEGRARRGEERVLIMDLLEFGEWPAEQQRPEPVQEPEEEPVVLEPVEEPEEEPEEDPVILEADQEPVQQPQQFFNAQEVIDVSSDTDSDSGDENGDRFRAQEERHRQREIEAQERAREQMAEPPVEPEAEPEEPMQHREPEMEPEVEQDVEPEEEPEEDGQEDEEEENMDPDEDRASSPEDEDPDMDQNQDQDHEEDNDDEEGQGQGQGGQGDDPEMDEVDEAEGEDVVEGVDLDEPPMDEANDGGVDKGQDGRGFNLERLDESDAEEQEAEDLEMDEVDEEEGGGEAQGVDQKEDPIVILNLMLREDEEHQDHPDEPEEEGAEEGRESPFQNHEEVEDYEEDPPLEDSDPEDPSMNQIDELQGEEGGEDEEVEDQESRSDDEDHREEGENDHLDQVENPEEPEVEEADEGRQSPQGIEDHEEVENHEDHEDHEDNPLLEDSDPEDPAMDQVDEFQQEEEEEEGRVSPLEVDPENFQIINLYDRVPMMEHQDQGDEGDHLGQGEHPENVEEAENGPEEEEEGEGRESPLEVDPEHLQIINLFDRGPSPMPPLEEFDPEDPSMNEVPEDEDQEMGNLEEDMDDEEHEDLVDEDQEENPVNVEEADGVPEEDDENSREAPLEVDPENLQIINLYDRGPSPIPPLEEFDPEDPSMNEVQENEDQMEGLEEDMVEQDPSDSEDEEENPEDETEGVEEAEENSRESPLEVDPETLQVVRRRTPSPMPRFEDFDPEDPSMDGEVHQEEGGQGDEVQECQEPQNEDDLVDEKDPQEASEQPEGSSDHLENQEVPEEEEDNEAHEPQGNWLGVVSPIPRLDDSDDEDEADDVEEQDKASDSPRGVESEDNQDSQDFDDENMDQYESGDAPEDAMEDEAPPPSSPYSHILMEHSYAKRPSSESQHDPQPMEVDEPKVPQDFCLLTTLPIFVDQKAPCYVPPFPKEPCTKCKEHFSRDPTVYWWCSPAALNGFMYSPALDDRNSGSLLFRAVRQLSENHEIEGPTTSESPAETEDRSPSPHNPPEPEMEESSENPTTSGSRVVSQDPSPSPQRAQESSENPSTSGSPAGSQNQSPSTSPHHVMEPEAERSSPGNPTTSEDRSSSSSSRENMFESPKEPTSARSSMGLHSPLTLGSRLFGNGI